MQKDYEKKSKNKTFSLESKFLHTNFVFQFWMTVCDEWCGNKTSFFPKGILKEINIKKTEIVTIHFY